MSNNGIPIHVDPFFDGEGDGSQEVRLPDYAEDTPGAMSGNVKGKTKAAASHNAGYHDINGNYTESGRPMAAVMRGGPGGLGGTIIPRSGLGGVPIGTQPHVTSNMQVNYDPHIPDQSVSLTLGEVTDASIRRAETAVANAGIPPASDANSMRLHGSAVMQAIASQNPHMPREEQQPPAVSGVATENIEAPNMSRVSNGHAKQAQARQIRPLAHFNQAPQTRDEYVGKEMRTIDLSNSPAAGISTQPPSKRVTFEIEQFGVHHANYHDVVVKPGFLILVYNSDYPGGEMYVPPAGENAPKMALHVSGDDTVYLVITTGLHYAYGGNEFCVLMIESKGQLTQDTGYVVPGVGEH
jgi:hypothetical protein